MTRSVEERWIPEETFGDRLRRIGTVHEAWRRPRVERHTETAGLGVETIATRPDWTRVTYPGCVTGQSVVVVYDDDGRWMSIGR